MESCQEFAEKRNKIRKKVIPWHCQQRYQTSLSQISFNHTLTTATYTRKIKSLLNNNKCLAKALERSRYELSDKENIVLNNAKNIDIINFSSLKLRGLSETLKKIAASVGETFALLQSHIATNPPKNVQCSSVPRSDFKKRLRSVPGIGTLEEVAECLENETNFSSEQNFKGLVSANKHSIKNKASKSKAKNTSSASNKKDTSAVQKCKNQRSKQQKATISQKVSVRTSKARIDDTPPSYLLGISADCESFRNLVEQSKKNSNYKPPKKNAKPKKTKQQGFSPGSHPVSAIYNSKDQPNELGNVSLVIQSSKAKSKKASCDKAQSNKAVSKPASLKKAKVASHLLDGSKMSQNSFEDTMSTTDAKSSESVEESASSSSEADFKALTMTSQRKFSSKNEIKRSVKSISNDNKDISPSGLQFDCQTLISNEYLHGTQPSVSKIPTDLQADAMLSEPGIIFTDNDLIQSDTFQKKEALSVNDIFDESKQLSKKSSNLKASVKPKDTSLKKKVGFLLNEDNEIEMLNEKQKPVSKHTTKKTQKRPLKESTKNLDSLPSKKRAKSIGLTEAPSGNDLKSKNTFVVRAEVHQPPEGYAPAKRPSLESIHLLNMQPYVVLTDIFRDTAQKGSVLETLLQSENQMAVKEAIAHIVEEEHCENQYSESTTIHKGDLNAKCDKENNIDGRIFLEDRQQRRRFPKVSTYKEMKLNVKMRRC